MMKNQRFNCIFFPKVKIKDIYPNLLVGITFEVLAHVINQGNEVQVDMPDMKK